MITKEKIKRTRKKERHRRKCEKGGGEIFHI